jgi:hypothetical protein
MRDYPLSAKLSRGKLLFWPENRKFVIRMKGGGFIGTGLLTRE